LALFIGAGCGKKSSDDIPPGKTEGVLRVVCPEKPFEGLPRGVDSGAREKRLVQNYAKDHQLEIEWISVPDDQIVAELLEGRGDMAIGCQLDRIDAGSSLLFTRPVFAPLKKTTRPSPNQSEQIVWAVPDSSAGRLKILNEFLVKEHSSVMPESRTGDLKKMKERGYIRVLTRNNPACYFIHRGELMGFEYELVKQYADQQGLDVVMIVPPRWADLKQWMLEGKGDIVAACITISDVREKSKELRFCHPYGNFNEIVVTRQSDVGLKSLGDLAGRKVHVRERSNYWDTMVQLKKESGIDFELHAVPGTMETREILHRVEKGEYDLTVADSGFLDIEINSGRKLRSAFMFQDQRNYGWVVRKNNPELKASIDRFLERKVGTSNYNYLYRKYFNQTSSIGKFQDEILSLEKAVVSPYDDLIRASAQKYDFHWCLIAAQMYQESRFDPVAKSWAGARGLMQLMPATAKEMGLNEHNMLEPAKNIDAGVHYLQRQRKRVPDEVDDFNRLCFGLAAYNGGYGHLIDARSLAKKLGRNPNLWVENVDYAYTLLSTPEYADKAKYGYCRSEEITGYVRKIIARQISYQSDMERLTQTSE
jgi:membrane-bound lytic murein transglycosylase F